MDPLTQGLLGATVAQAVFTRHLGRRAALVGWVGGMLADADVLLLPWSDPALPQEWHRHFTHAIAFIPIGGLLAAMPFFCWRWYRQRGKAVLGAATVAYATHGLLDCCTSYGTHWLWPFSSVRLAWDMISIIDPIFSSLLLIGFALALGCRHGRPAVLALLLATTYIGFGVLQHGRASYEQVQLATRRGHTVKAARAMPTLGNIFVWHCVYVAGDRIHTDAVRVGLWGQTTVRTGGTLPLFQPHDVPTTTPRRQRVVDVLTRFGHFADGYMARAPSQPQVVADMRYSAVTGDLLPLWGILIDVNNSGDPVSWVHFRADRIRALRRLWREVLGEMYDFAP